MGTEEYENSGVMVCLELNSAMQTESQCTAVATLLTYGLWSQRSENK